MSNESPSDMEQFWQEFVLDRRKNANRDREDNDGEACSIIKAARKQYDHMTYVEISVLVPVCAGCRYSESKLMEETTPTPHVFGQSWEEDYAALGVPRKKIAAARETLESGSWVGPNCFVCGSSMPLEDGGEPFYVRNILLSEFLGLDRARGRKPTAWMKRIVLGAYEAKCAACQKELSEHDTTFDHIVPVGENGETELDNLQPMCKDCNQKKKNLPVKTVEHPPLTFALLPPSEWDEFQTDN
jgi:hypothetical protein